MASRTTRTIGFTNRFYATAGVGYEITAPARQRRSYGVITGPTASADRHLTKHTLSRLREICRMYDRQSSLFSGILNRALDNIFGANFDFIPNTGEPGLNLLAKRYITEQMAKGKCDASGIHSFSSLARLVLRAIWNDGDILLAKRKTGQVLIYEADQIDTPNDKSNQRITLGVELDELNTPKAFHVKQRSTLSSGSIAKSTSIPAQFTIFPAYRTRFGQTRGVPYLAAVLAFFDRTNNYLDYESFAAEINAQLGWKITRQPTTDDLGGMADNDETDTTFDKVQKMEPGQIFDLLAGEDVDMIGSKRPGDNFDSYLVACCRIIGVGVGMPLELLMLDFSKTNYSSARAALGEARRMFRCWQRFSESEFCLPWYRWQIARGIALGILPARVELYRARCQWPAWEYIDPVKEANGNVIAINAGIKTVSQCIREQGGEPDEVFAERRDELRKFKEFGITQTAAVEPIVQDTPDKDDDDEKEVA